MNKNIKAVVKAKTSRWWCHKTPPYYLFWLLLCTSTRLLEN